MPTGKEILDRNRNRLGNVNMLSLEHYRLEADRFDEIKKHRKQFKQILVRRQRSHIQRIKAPQQARPIQKKKRGG